MRFLACNNLGHHNALVLAFVRKHRPTNNITNRINPCNRCLAIIIHGHKAPCIYAKANRLEVEILGIGNPSNGYNQAIDRQCMGLTITIGIVQCHALGRRFHITDFDPEVNI